MAPRAPEPVVLSDRYELARLLGRGGMAEVHLGRDRALGRWVAVKLLTGHEPQDAERLQDEARAAAAIDHPNVVAVHDIGLTTAAVFVVMEYLDGESLRQLLHREVSLAPETAARIGAEACLALAAAHRAGVIHRDISPGNIMLCRDGAVKVMDFGIARMTGAAWRTATGQVLGTPAYLSPEQIEGGALDPRCDLYAVGCCLYQMATGRAPFTGSTALAVAYQHVRRDPEPPRALDPAIPPRLEAVILRALAKRPADRYPDAAEMRADLLQAGADVPAPRLPSSTLVLPTDPPVNPAPAPQPDGSSCDPGDTDDTDDIDDPDVGTWRRWVGAALIAVAILVLAVAALAVGLSR